MKHELASEQPACLVEDWPGKYKAFPWLEYAVTVPNPIFIVTTTKGNGLPNAALESWQLLLGSGDDCYSLLGLLQGQHTYGNILREKEWCINYPGVAHYQQCFETIWHNGEQNDEITDAGFTLEPCIMIKSPRILECPINLECRLVREEALVEGSDWHLLIGRVVHTAIDDEVMAIDPTERIRAMGMMYNVRGTVNPIDGRHYATNTLGLLDRVMKVFHEDGTDPEWKRKDRRP
jgi:flavin reductase (DIM6/NTAB) family NADH-FMN oxidoreductase RutF